jgi:DNA uptake protein ComE-like DNA-binding protein
MIDPAWKKYFYFSNKELKGIVVLGFILLGSVLVSQLLSTKPRVSALEKLNSQFKLFNFDPNLIDSQSAILLGIPARQVMSLLHYRAKGGRFKNKDDFARLYGLTEEKYQLLRPYIVMAEAHPKQYYTSKQGNRNNQYYKYNDSYNGKEVKGKMNINSINEKEWEAITPLNIGLIKRIIAYKNYLGVYKSIYQLNKVYGMNDSTFQLLRAHIYVDNKHNELPNANALNFNDWKNLNLFTDRQIWTILKMKKANQGKISWSELVESFDLSEMEAKALKSKIQLSD